MMNRSHFVAGGAFLLGALTCLSTAAAEDAVAKASQQLRSDDYKIVIQGARTLAARDDTRSWGILTKALCDRATMKALRKPWALREKNGEPHKGRDEVGAFLRIVARGEAGKAAVALLAALKQYDRAGSEAECRSVAYALQHVKTPDKELLDFCRAKLSGKWWASYALLEALSAWGTDASIALFAKHGMEHRTLLLRHKNRFKNAELYLRERRDCDKFLAEFHCSIDHLEQVTHVKYPEIAPKGAEAAKFVQLFSDIHSPADGSLVVSEYRKAFRSLSERIAAENCNDSAFKKEMAKVRLVASFPEDTVYVLKSPRKAGTAGWFVTECRKLKLEAIEAKALPGHKGVTFFRSKKWGLLAKKDDAYCQVGPESIGSYIRMPDSSEECASLLSLFHPRLEKDRVQLATLRLCVERKKYWPEKKFPSKWSTRKLGSLGLSSSPRKVGDAYHWGIAVLEGTELVAYKYVVSPGKTIGRLRIPIWQGPSAPPRACFCGDPAGLRKLAQWRHEASQKAIRKFVELARKNAPEAEWKKL